MLSTNWSSQQATLSLGTLVAFLSYVQMFFRPLRNLAQQYGTMQTEIDEVADKYGDDRRTELTIATRR